MSEEPAKSEYKITLTAKNKPLYNLPDEDQMYFSPKGRLYVVYDDDHDEENSDGSFSLHDVTDQYDFKVEKL